MSAAEMKKRILVVDDEKEIVEFINEVLEDRYEILTATDGPGALAILDKEDVDLILLDIAMQEMDGNKVLKSVRGNPKTAAVPVCIVTAIAASNQKQTSLLFGANDYLVKPFKIEKLLDTVAALLGEPPPEA